MMSLDELDEAWHVLTDRQKEVITRRFGLKNGTKPETLEAIGKSFGVGRECIRHHQNTAIRKLRWAGHQLEAHGKIQPSLFPKPKKAVKPVAKPVKKRKPTPKPNWKPPPRTDTERLDWLENWIPGSAMAIRRDYKGGLSLYRGNDTQLSGANLRELLDLILFKNVSPENK